MEKYITIVDGDKITVQRAAYIEDGAYIEIIGNTITLFEIPAFGGEAYRIRDFPSLLEAIEYSKTLT